jgi:mono/diheme cytochrome c family protein
MGRVAGRPLIPVKRRAGAAANLYPWMPSPDPAPSPPAMPMTSRSSVAIAILVIAAFAASLLLVAQRATPAEAARGQALYEAKCSGCHSESVHGRRNRAAGDFDSVRRWVARWSDNLGLRWDAGEIDDVAAYLNGRYYRYPCPPDACKVVSLGTT